jgi:methyltransferase
MIALLLVLLVAGPMLIEAGWAARNERAQRTKGGIEPPGDVYPLMQVAYPASFLVMIAEGFWRGGPSSRTLALGAAVFLFAKALKWWAIATLGQAWTFRVIVVPGARRIRSGPYRLFNHPNYVGVVGELLGVALMAGARVSGPLATALFLLLILKRVSVENRALNANLTS